MFKEFDSSRENYVIVGDIKNFIGRWIIEYPRKIPGKELFSNLLRKVLGTKKKTLHPNT